MDAAYDYYFYKYDKEKCTPVLCRQVIGLSKKKSDNIGSSPMKEEILWKTGTNKCIRFDRGEKW